MGYTDETVRFDFDDNRKKEISETLTIVYNALAEKATTRLTKSSAIYYQEILRIFLVIKMHET